MVESPWYLNLSGILYTSVQWWSFTVEEAEAVLVSLQCFPGDAQSAQLTEAASPSAQVHYCV